jgi:2,4-dienoyl-CoA reductase (NADPH2)
MLSTSKFTKLFEPLQIKQITFRNRIVKPPQRMGYADKDGGMTPQALGFYESIARGGVGALIVEHAYIDFPLGVRGIQFSVADDRFIPGLTELVNMVHKHGCPVIQQINHAGPQLDPMYLADMAGAAPSDLRDDYMQKTFGRAYRLRSLPISEIENIIDKFANSAERVQKAGYDGLEIHAAHTYLLACFLSRIWNKREDVYGCQTFENRTKLHTAIIRAVRERVGPLFLVGIRINGAEYGAEDGTTSSESQQIAKILESAGADYIHVISDAYGAYNRYLLSPLNEQPHPLNHGLNTVDKRSILLKSTVPLAAAIKEVVTIPVIAAGKLDPFKGEKALRNGSIDLVSVGRRLFADPDLPRKVAEGNVTDVVPCLNCGTCTECNAKNVPVICRVNPALGNENASEIIPTKRRKKVVVVGSGPAGMEAAIIATRRGHEVVVYEKESNLGGMLPLAAIIKGSGNEPIPALIRYFKRQIVKMSVRVILGQEFTSSLFKSIRPEVLIIACGASPRGLRIPGIDHRNVFSSEDLHNQIKLPLRLLGPQLAGILTRLWLPIGKNVLVVGGSIHGCEVAEFLVRRGRKVSIVESTYQLGEGIPDANRKALLFRLRDKGVSSVTDAKYLEIVDSKLVRKREKSR